MIEVYDLADHAIEEKSLPLGNFMSLNSPTSAELSALHSYPPLLLVTAGKNQALQEVVTAAKIFLLYSTMIGMKASDRKDRGHRAINKLGRVEASYK